MTQRKIEKKDNFFAIELNEGDEVEVRVKGQNAIDIDDVVFIAPYDGFMNSYLKRHTSGIQYKD